MTKKPNERAKPKHGIVHRKAAEVRHARAEADWWFDRMQGGFRRRPFQGLW